MFAIGNSKWDRYNAILKYLYCIAVSFELVTDSLVHSRKGQEREINMKKILTDMINN